MLPFSPRPLPFYPLRHTFSEVQVTDKLPDLHFQVPVKQEGLCHGVWIIEELEWFRLEDFSLLWGCWTFVCPLQLLPEVDSGRSFKLTYLSFIGKGAFGIEVVLCVRCPLEATEPVWDLVLLCLLMYKLPSNGSDRRDPLIIWVDSHSGQWNDRNSSHGGAGVFPFFWGVEVGLVKVNACR